MIKIRGQRVRSVRGLSGLSRNEFSKLTGISSSTIQSWEDAKAGGLTRRGAEKLSLAFVKIGILVTAEYFLSGNGVIPINTRLTKHNPDALKVIKLLIGN